MADTNNIIDQLFSNFQETLTDFEKLVIEKKFERGIPKHFSAMDLLLRKNLVEMQSKRRHPKKGFLMTRHILCTRNFYMANRLAKIKGKRVYVNERKNKEYYRDHKMLLVWDIVINDWRMINLENRSKLGIIDFVPFRKNEHFKVVAEAYSKDFKRIRSLNGAKFKSYCNLVREGTFH